MSKTIEDLKPVLTLALEVLEEAVYYVNDEASSPSMERDCVQAITAIREALADKCVCGEPDTPGTHRTDGPCLAEQPAHRQQEPVAWVVEDQNGERLEWAEVAHIGWGWKKLPLYTSLPASKPWEGLTDGNYRWMWSKAHNDTSEDMPFLVFARAIEAKLREKNEHREKNA